MQDKNSTDIICWLPEGNGFQILNTSAFTDQVLPENFKHRNMASFVRQLNMYGFNRPKESGQNVYIHPRFQKGNLSSIKLIKRKIGSTKAHDDSSSPEHWKSSPEQNHDGIMLEYQKLAAENDILRKQNQELIIRLGKFEEMIGKIKVYTQEIDHLLLMRRDQVETEKTEKQATASNCSSEGSLNSLNSGSQLNRKGFSLCNSGPFQSSYQILLQGKPDQN